MTTNRVLYGQRLNDRERRVVANVAHGRTNRQIADRLGLSPETVKTYISWINKKLGAHNRAHAVTIAAVKGYIDLHPKETKDMVDIDAAQCETGACWFVVELGDAMVAIHGEMVPWIAPGWAVDSIEAWRKFRDDIKAGAWDHIGETQ